MKYYLISKKNQQQIEIERFEALILLKGFYHENEAVLNKLEYTAPNSINLNSTELKVENN